jgi:secondary thiamine-phosphate synthase enzyme
VKQARHTLTVRAAAQGLHEITAEVAGWVAAQDVADGLLTLFVRHTSASLTIQENADPDVRRDLADFFARIAPEDSALYRHTAEGPDDMPAHIRAALTATQLSIPVAGARPMLGTWQGVYLFEHRRRPAPREIVLHLAGE